MVDYSLGKIYKIVCNTTGLTYYGSTCEPTLARRLAGHRDSFKRFKRGKTTNITSFKVLESENHAIILVESFPCIDKMNLLQRERYYIENNECVNKQIPTRTDEEYYLQNRDKMLETHAEYYLINRDRLIENQKNITRKIETAF